MGVLVIVAGALGAIAALFVCEACLLAWSDGEGWKFGVAAFVAVLVGVLMVPVIRQGAWMVSTASCDGVAVNNESLDVKHLELTYWDFGCHVDTGDGVIPWSRYRAVIDG